MSDFEPVHRHLEALMQTATVAALDDTTVEGWLQLAQRHRMVPALHFLAEARGLDTTTTEAAFESAVAIQLLVESAADAVLEILRSADIDVRVVKGLATGHLDYPNPVLRQFGDADLVVAPDQFERAVVALNAAGHTRKYDNLQRDDWRMQHGIPIGVDRMEVDLHSRLLHQGAGHLAHKLGLMDAPDEFEVAGRPAMALRRPVRLAQAAAQNVVSAENSRKMSSDLDVLILLDYPGIETEAVERAREVGLGWVVEAGIHRARTLAGYPTEAPRPRTATDRIMASAHGDSQTAFRAGLAEFAVAPLRHKATMVRANIAPGEAYLATRNRSRSDHLKRQLRRIVGRSRST